MTTAHNIVPAPGPAFVRPSGGGGPTVRTKPWPEWAMLRAEEVRAKLPPEQWGPWNHQGPCLVSNNTTGSSQMQPHPTDSPALLLLPGAPAGDQSKNPHRQAVASPGPGQVLLMRRTPPSRCRSRWQTPSRAWRRKETNSTVARLKTKRYCAGCNPYHRPLCRGRICRETGQKRRVQPAGCCNITSTSRRRHCAKCCVGAAANRSAQVMAPTTIAAGTAARRTLGNERRARIRGLHCEGLDNRAIAHGLGVSVRTVPRALKAANDLATDRT